MIPYGRQSITRRDIDAVVNVLKSDWLTQGPKIFEFEKALAKYCGAKYAITCSSGTAALHLAYLACGIGAGDEAITSANTCAPTSNMMLALGARPVFCDIRPDTCNIDESKIESLIAKKTKAIVPVHFAGHPAAMEEIWKLARRYKLFVIEDAAHALGASYRGRKIGSGKSDLVIFSFHPVKSITTGEGGAVLTNNKSLFDKLVLLRSHGFVKDKNGFNQMLDLGFNYRLTDMQAALGLSQLNRLSSFIEKRRQIAKQYYKNLKNCDEIILPTPHPHPLPFKGRGKKGEGAWHLFVIRVKNAKERLPLMRYLKNRGIGTQLHYQPVYSHPYYRKIGYAKKQNCPVADQYGRTALSIPLYPDLSATKVRFISKAIRDFYAR